MERAARGGGRVAGGGTGCLTARKMESALYEGIVRHRRFTPRLHRFSYPVFMLYVDLDELDGVGAVSRLLSTRRFGVAWIRRGDPAAS